MENVMIENFLRRIDQVCLVVKDLQQAMERYWSHFRVGPWKVYLFQEPTVWDLTFKGEPASYSMLLAMYQAENLVIELIQPLSGETTYREFLEKSGDGLHHLGFFTPDLDGDVKKFKAIGIPTLQTGRFEGGGFAYLDTQEKFGTILELIQRANPPLKPLRVYPEEAGK